MNQMANFHINKKIIINNDYENGEQMTSDVGHPLNGVKGGEKGRVGGQFQLTYQA